MRDGGTSGGFITVLADAYLVPSGSAYVVYGQASGQILCSVDAATAERALTNPSRVTLLGYWSGTFRGRTDTWSIWYSHDVPWAATSDVTTPEHATRLVDEFADEVMRAEREGRVHSPSPPPSGWAPNPAPPHRPRSTSGGFGEGFMDGLSSFFGVRRKR